jgi:hypothetical protein
LTIITVLASSSGKQGRPYFLRNIDEAASPTP